MKHEIEIPDLPGGYKAVVFRPGIRGESIIGCNGVVILDKNTISPHLIIEKIQPRRIVLEETNEVRKANRGEYYYNNGFVLCLTWPMQTEGEYKIWRVVEEDKK